MKNNGKILIGFLVLVALVGGTFFFYNFEKQSQDVSVQKAPKNKIERVKESIIKNRFVGGNQNDSGGGGNPDTGSGNDTNPDTGSGNDTNPDTGSGNDTNPDTGTGHETGSGYNTVSYPIFTLTSGTGNNTITYGIHQEVFRFSISAATPGDVLVNRITLESYSQGLNTGTSGLGAPNSWELYNESTGTSIATATMNQNKITFEIGAQRPEAIERDHRNNYVVYARILDDGWNNQNSIITRLLKDYSTDVDFDQRGTQYYGTYDQIDDPWDNNQIIWKDDDNQNRYLNSRNIPVDTRSATYR